MKFLIDNALSIAVSEGLKRLGYDSVHVREIGLQHAEDQAIFDKALEEDRTIVSADTDFGWLLANWPHKKPSVILFRKGAERDPVQQIELLKINLSDQLKEVITSGSVVIIESARIRIRELPVRKK